MFVVTLKFAANKVQAPQLMQSHNDWLAQGFADGVFVLSGSLQPGLGGAIMAQGCTLAQLEALVAKDPFVAEGVVTAEILDITPGRTDPRLDFLRG